MVPKNPSITSIPNWQKDPNNTQYDEQVFFDSKIRAKDASASVILNHEYFYKAYKQYMDPVIKELNQVSS